MKVDAGVTVQLGRLERRGVLLGLSPAQTGVLGTGLFLVVVGEYSFGAPGLLLTLPVWALLAGLALVRYQSRELLAWLPLVASWMSRTVHAGRSYRVNLADVGSTAIRIPGVRGRLAVLSAPGSGAALLHDRGLSTVTAALRVSGAGFVLAEETEQWQLVSGWSRLLAGLCQQPKVRRAQVLVRTAPHGGAEITRWWSEHALPAGSWAARILAEVVSTAKSSSTAQDCFLAISLRVPRRHLGTAVDVSPVVRQLDAIETAVRSAGLHLEGWVTPARLASVLRGPFDPTGRRTEPGTNLVGPMAVDEEWDALRTDTAHHAVYWVQEWPRSQTHAGFLQPLLLAPGEHRTLSLIAEPLRPAKALKDIRRAKVEHIADAAQRARMGQVEDESVRAQAADLARREQELVAGHGDLRFVGLLAVSANSREALNGACASAEGAAAQSMCELRKLVGQQAAAYAAAALPFARSVT